MNISLTPDQEHFVQTKLQVGKYRSAEEVLEIAFRLLDEYERSEADWVDEVREKVDAAIDVSKHTPPIDGETFVNTMLARLQQTKEACRYVISVLASRDLSEITDYFAEYNVEAGERFLLHSTVNADRLLLSQAAANARCF